MFEEFYTKHHEVPATVATPMNTQTQNPLLNTLAAVLMAGIPTSLALPPALPTALPTALPIDPANTAIKCKYPDVEEFFAKLAEENPRRNLNNMGEKLSAQDFFCIDEIADEKEQFYQEPPYSLSPGNAKFVVKSVKDAIEVARRQTS